MSVIIGMDPHKRSATIEVVDERGRVLAMGRFGTDKAGYADMLAAGRKYADRVWTVEGAATARLVHDGETVLDVPAKLSAQVRVFATGNGRKKPTWWMRTRWRWWRCEAAPQARATMSRVKPRDIVGKSRSRLAVELISELEGIDKKIKAAEKDLKELVAARSATLMELRGIGPTGAAHLLADVADISPINRTVHIMAVVQLRNRTEDRAYFDAKRPPGRPHALRTSHFPDPPPNHPKPWYQRRLDIKGCHERAPFDIVDCCSGRWFRSGSGIIVCMGQLGLFSRAELAAMRDRTRSRRYSPAKEQFRREHARHRDWGLARRHAEKLRRVRGDTPPGVSDQRDGSVHGSVQGPVPPSPPPPVTQPEQAQRPASGTAASDCDPAPRQVGGDGRSAPVPKHRRACTPQLRRPAGPATHRMIDGNTRPPVHRDHFSTMPRTAGRHFRRMLRKAGTGNRCTCGPPVQIPECLDKRRWPTTRAMPIVRYGERRA
ncbi:hypothetical protein ABT297_32130 [Dactylosporangium sp. NPDC000555]|uniref:hypothetical protein n=1 Tax=Dactylosporangium sp. NPDC000555 TaxID=3154260 RepID=UPI0033175E02